MLFKSIHALVLWTKLASALEELMFKHSLQVNMLLDFYLPGAPRRVEVIVLDSRNGNPGSAQTRQYVTTYRLLYSTNGIHFFPYQESVGIDKVSNHILT